MYDVIFLIIAYCFFGESLSEPEYKYCDFCLNGSAYRYESYLFIHIMIYNLYTYIIYVIFNFRYAIHDCIELGLVEQHVAVSDPQRHPSLLHAQHLLLDAL